MEVVNISKFLHMILCYTYSDIVYFIDDEVFMPHQYVNHILPRSWTTFHLKAPHSPGNFDADMLTSKYFEFDHHMTLPLPLQRTENYMPYTMSCGYFIAFQRQRNGPK